MQKVALPPLLSALASNRNEDFHQFLISHTRLSSRDSFTEQSLNLWQHSINLSSILAGDFRGALRAYTEALKATTTAGVTKESSATEISPEDNKQRAALHSNRAAAHEQLEDFSSALQDAESAVVLAPDWPKAQLRCASQLLPRYSSPNSYHTTGICTVIDTRIGNFFCHA